MLRHLNVLVRAKNIFMVSPCRLLSLIQETSIIVLSTLQ